MLLRVADLACARSGRRIFAGVSFTVGPGEALVITGRNGAGKSTLLSCLAGLLEPLAGRIEADPDERPRRELTHFVGHRDGLKGALTAAENLRTAAALLGPGQQNVGSALAEVGLAGLAAVPAAYLSAGQRRRLALARLLVAPRPIWLLDEPATALDATGQSTLSAMVEHHRAAGGLVVAATHAPLAFGAAATLTLGHGPLS